MTNILTDRGVDGPYLFDVILRVFQVDDRAKAAEYLLDVLTDIEVDIPALAKCVMDMDILPQNQKPQVFLETFHTFVVENNLHA